MTCCKCGRELDGVFLEMPELKWKCAECSSDPKDAMYCRRGDRVRYAHPENGTASAKLMCERYLAPGNIYYVDEVQVGRSSTHVKVQGLKYWFNSVMLERVT